VLQPIIPIVNKFVCQEYTFKSTNQDAIRKHVNKIYNKKRAVDKDILKVVRLQSWFGEKREQYWVVDESQQIAQERQACQAAIRDIGKEFNLEANTSNSSDSDSKDSQDGSLSNSLDNIIKDIKG
jgi:hypothetical protein